MPYVNIPDSGLGGIVAKVIGKLLGNVSGNALETVRSIQNQLSEQGCPLPTENRRLKNKQTRVQQLTTRSNNRINKFKRLPPNLKNALTGLKAAKTLILTLPIPQAVPPGIGLPILITTKYADFLHLLKEMIKQIDELVNAIEVVLSLPEDTLKSMQQRLGAAETVLKGCDVENSLKAEVARGALSEQLLGQLGIIDEDGTYIYSNLGPVLLASDKKYRGKWTAPRGYQKFDIVSYLGQRWVCQKAHISDIKGGTETGPPPVGPWVEQNQQTLNSYNSLTDSTKKLNDSSIDDVIKSRLRATLVDFSKTVDNNTIGSGNFKVGPNGELIGNIPDKNNPDDPGKFLYTAPNGETYKLEIENDPTSPPIAPRRFAVAKNKDGITVLKGPKSFSSSVDILLDEIKFRIDNQLP